MLFRWQPFRRSAYIKEKHALTKVKLQPEDKKFFGALMKPKVLTVLRSQMKNWPLLSFPNEK